MNYWVFQAAPNRYNLVEAVKNLDADRWTVPSQYRNQLRKGDKVFFWKAAGKEGKSGIYAFGEITSSVSSLPELPQARPYVISGDYLGRTALRVDVKYIHKLKSPILRSALLTHGILKNLMVIKVRAGQVFPVREHEIKPLCDLVVKSC
jgi:predicted RNA-binding protein with PUA-like domain